MQELEARLGLDTNIETSTGQSGDKAPHCSKEASVSKLWRKLNSSVLLPGHTWPPRSAISRIDGLLTNSWS